jgi:hypothetical protein
MHKEDVLKFGVGQWGSCGLTLRFWQADGSEVRKLRGPLASGRWIQKAPAGVGRWGLFYLATRCK